MYNPDGANDYRTIPYRTDGDPTVGNLDLATTQQIFELAYKDLEYALEYAPDFVSNPCRANKAAIYALLAEYYMYRRDWPNMLTYANLAWTTALNQKGGIGNMIYDYNTWSYNSIGNPTPGPDDPSPEIDWTLNAPDGYNQTYAIENLFYRTQRGPVLSDRRIPRAVQQ